MKIIHITFLIIIALSSCTYGKRVEVNSKNIEESLSYGELEKPDLNLAKFKDGQIYIDKYQLSIDEINQVGIWFVYKNLTADENIGPGIGITFFPNRIFKTYRANTEVGKTEYTFGMWEVKNKVLYIKPVKRAIKLGDYKYKFESLDTKKFYPIVSLEQFTNAFINQRSYTFASFPQKILDFYSYHDNDLVRFRFLWDTLGDPPGDLSPDSKNGRAFQIQTLEDTYLEKLVEVW